MPSVNEAIYKIINKLKIGYCYKTYYDLSIEMVNTGRHKPTYFTFSVEEFYDRLPAFRTEVDLHYGVIINTEHGPTNDWFEERDGSKRTVVYVPEHYTNNLERDSWTTQKKKAEQFFININFLRVTEKENGNCPRPGGGCRVMINLEELKKRKSNHRNKKINQKKNKRTRRKK
jgi:hypothetical protein